ncbi:bb3-type cytochrome oxidase subunit III [Paraherbaspirillum soli]|uniref:Bb3-type cytochrome oxidase subunit III n=1 Tax=Paraherbaspirillum soli TaxID=631222 RepID=A0ABW0MDY2_9BURK
MNPGPMLRAAGVGPQGYDSPAPRSGPDYRRRPGIDSAAASIALWLFMIVASTLFLLFLTAYAMRMNAGDWSPLAMPWQLWLSTLLLAGGSVLLHFATQAARAAHLSTARTLLLAGGACVCVFLGVQWWGWQALLTIHVTAAGNPAGSFFYLLTAMHGLHVVGGLVAWARTARGAWRYTAAVDAAQVAWRIALCARYWHFLLALWIVLFAALGWLTPDLVRLVCGIR